MTGLHFHALTVREVRRDTDDAVVVSFDVPGELTNSFRFGPGQYLTLRSAALGGDVRRSYSICAAPGEALRVGIRHVPDGAFSGWLHTSLKAGDTLEAMEPQGRFGASVGKPARHVLLVAGGSGITPILSILKTLLAADASTQCTLLYGNRSAASTMFKEEIEDLKNRHLTRLSVHVVFSREVVDSPLNAGRIDGDKVATFLRLAGRVDEAYVCGPHAMNDEVEAALQAAGLAHDQIHIERFGVPPSEPVQRGPVVGEVSGARIVVVRDGITRELAFESGDESILAAAGRAGLDVPYSCRSGVCATCRAKVLEGQVSMTRNFALEADDIAAGFVLTCQAHPLSERVVVSYDDR
jgi:ring-1,2-phenylacetyl-CoA epoxidase subunit PaaE